GAQKICLSHSPGKPLTVKSILSNFQNMDKIEKGPKEIFSPEIQKNALQKNFLPYTSDFFPDVSIHRLLTCYSGHADQAKA
ncbi:hypothetical protein CDAR_370171, partial [Caerostris darwini]